MKSRLSCLLKSSPLVVLLLVSSLLGAEESRNGSADYGERPLRLAFIGDIMAHDVNFLMDDYSRVYSSVEPLFAESDYVFGQLEFVVDPDRPMASYPRFNVHPGYVEAAIEAGVDTFSLANNHTTDYGAEGVRATLRTMKELADRYPIRYSGARWEDDESLDVVDFEWEGRRIGFLAITRILNDWSGYELTYVVDWSDFSTSRFLQRLEVVAGDYDLFILSVHDGTEYQPLPDDRSIAFYRDAVDAGVDILWGHHPHVLQPWERVSRDDGRIALIMPSMGNFVSGQTWRLAPEDTDHWRAETGDSAILRATVDFSDNGATVVDINPVLITHYHHPEGGVSVETLMPMRRRVDVAGRGWRPFYESRTRRSAPFARRREYEQLGEMK